MVRPLRVALVLLLLVAACGLNLSLTRWGTNQPGIPILTIATEPSFPAGVNEPGQFGLYAAPHLDTAPWTAMAFGLILPLMLIGVMVYILVRPRRPGSKS